MVLAEKQRQQAAAAQAKAWVDKATKQRCHEAAAREKTLANKANKQMPRVGQTCCGIGGVIICRRTTSLFICSAVEDGNKFGHRKGIGKAGGVCRNMGCNVGRNGIDRGATLP